MSPSPVSAQQQSPTSAQWQSGQEQSAQQFQQLVRKFAELMAMRNEQQLQQELTQIDQVYGQSEFDGP
jgi:ABC-type transport system involved in cytochrome bd biosynthesis fused ATPase/permease subunit